ncbi:MAG: Uma2 family endonuclease [Saprospiraceae bacterium]|nr:Uma2 family endonuclease [Saprospiraceae bacterium]MCF8248969.1 Uma2 family endonuclease [Saprospiraceae bacterium]MCF8279180.1 Uma2 family endonuclease [Bacteroidales bacterium]MCF8310863.1 Uma2 family endonuclease [Saprospiraceae bacterium]MCF8439549.1 Uma2 family endonuclease [Saprospiraceae bacterium]
MNAPLAAKKRISFDEYVAAEQADKDRHEFHDGFLTPIEATTKNHNTIVTNILLNSDVPRLRKNGCQIFHENVITEVREKRWGVYPDIVITCDPKDKENPLVVKHPKVIVEVLSKSTAPYDKAGKFFKYQRIPSLQQYILISQYTVAVEYYLRMENDQWVYKALDSLEDVLVLPSLSVEILLSDLYSAVVFEEP